MLAYSLNATPNDSRNNAANFAALQLADSVVLPSSSFARRGLMFAAGESPCRVSRCPWLQSVCNGGCGHMQMSRAWAALSEAGRSVVTCPFSPAVGLYEALTEQMAKGPGAPSHLNEWGGGREITVTKGVDCIPYTHRGDARPGQTCRKSRMLSNARARTLWAQSRPRQCPSCLPFRQYSTNQIPTPSSHSPCYYLSTDVRALTYMHEDSYTAVAAAGGRLRPGGSCRSRNSYRFTAPPAPPRHCGRPRRLAAPGLLHHCRFALPPPHPPPAGPAAAAAVCRRRRCRPALPTLPAV